jgi:hypothetical protein
VHSMLASNHKNVDIVGLEQKEILDRTLDEIPDCQVPGHR